MKRISTIMIASLLVMGTTAVAQSIRFPGKTVISMCLTKSVPATSPSSISRVTLVLKDLSKHIGTGKCGHQGTYQVKLHTGSRTDRTLSRGNGLKPCSGKDLSDANIVETNTYYEGDRYTTEQHRRTLEVNGWTFCPVDILDERRHPDNTCSRW